MRLGGCGRRGDGVCTAFGAEEPAFFVVGLGVMGCGGGD